MEVALPQAVRACLWSWHIDQMDFSVRDHRTRLIENILNRGTTPAVTLIFEMSAEMKLQRPWPRVAHQSGMRARFLLGHRDSIDFDFLIEGRHL